MVELTAEIVRTIVKESVTAIVDSGVGSLRSEMNQRFDQIDTKIEQGLDSVRNELREGLESNRAETMDGINRVLETVQALTDDDRDEMSGLRGRLHNHNERISRLERLNNLR